MQDASERTADLSASNAVPRLVAAGLLVAAIWLGAAPAYGDPGRPGLADASEAVYPSGPPIPPPGGNDDQDDPPGTPVGSEEEGDITDAAIPGSVAPPSSPSSATPSVGSSLPFTGMLAPLLLGIGLLVLGLGLTAKKLHARGVFR